LVGKEEHGKSIYVTSDINYKITLTEMCRAPETGREIKRQREKYKIASLQKNER